VNDFAWQKASKKQVKSELHSQKRLPPRILLGSQVNIHFPESHYQTTAIASFI
jgi:hypothetical protein